MPDWDVTTPRRNMGKREDEPKGKIREKINTKTRLEERENYHEGGKKELTRIQGDKMVT